MLFSAGNWRLTRNSFGLSWVL